MKHAHNFYRYNILVKNKKLKIHIRGVEGSVNKFTAGVYDFKNDRILHYEDYDAPGDVNMIFAVGENVDGLAFCVYAGQCGRTQNQELRMNIFEVWEETI